MQEEMKLLNENHTYNLVKLPKAKEALKNKWVYKLKTEITHNNGIRLDWLMGYLATSCCVG